MSLLHKKKTSAKQAHKKARPDAQSQEKARQIIDFLLGPVLVDFPVYFPSDGAIERHYAIATWSWIVRDVDSKLEQEAQAAMGPDVSANSRVILSAKIAKLIASVISASEKNAEFARRTKIQLGGEEAFERLVQLENAFRHQQLLPKAVIFGKAINGLNDENSLKLALQTFPMDDENVSALMMHAAMGYVANPNRLVSIILDLSDGHTQLALTRAGFAPIIDGLISHAQNQLSYFAGQNARFEDIDMKCHALDRYHKLLRALSSITENDTSSAWAHKVSTLVRRMSELVEPKLSRIDSDVRQSMRKPRTGPDRLDADLLLDALNGIYLLAAVREALDTLALNSVVNKLWIEVGKSLEILIGRNLEAFRNAPNDNNIAQRLNTGIKMAEIRFNPEYARILTRARDGATRRTAS